MLAALVILLFLFNIGGIEDLERNWARIQKELR